MARADRPVMVAQRLTAPRLSLLGADKLVVVLGLFLQPSQALADFSKRLVGLVVALDEFDGDGLQVFKFVLHRCKAGPQVVQGEVDQPNDKPGRRNRSSGGKTVFVKKVGKIQPVPQSCYSPDSSAAAAACAAATTSSVQTAPATA